MGHPDNPFGRNFLEDSIREIIVVVAGLIALVLFYAVESFRLEKNRRCLALRICVTGARGKSSVTRLLAAALREGGFKVLAKTTGSRPMLLLPDGSEVELNRRGRPSVLEQLKVMRRAVELSADVVVAELMSIRPKTLAIESRRIFKPNILLITNARPDHTEHWGPSQETAARCLASAIGPDCTVFVPDEEMRPLWEEAAARKGAEICTVKFVNAEAVAEHFPNPDMDDISDTPLRFESNVQLVQAVTDSLNIDRELAEKGIRRSLPDLGGLRIWSWQPNLDGPVWDCVSAFAANDPDSTRMVLEKLTALGLINGKPVIGLLHLRRDRGDRTLQWLEALRAGNFLDLQELYVTGTHARAFKRRLCGNRSSIVPVILKSARPEGIMSALTANVLAPALVLGMGNMGGTGRELVEYWEREGTPRAV
ncbi:MAG: poly-gamma-glutamate synthase PgsB [Candidatus Aminicenantaceae bacterium]